MGHCQFVWKIGHSPRVEVERCFHLAHLYNIYVYKSSTLAKRYKIKKYNAIGNILGNTLGTEKKTKKKNPPHPTHLPQKITGFICLPDHLSQIVKTQNDLAVQALMDIIEESMGGMEGSFVVIHIQKRIWHQKIIIIIIIIIVIMIVIYNNN